MPLFFQHNINPDSRFALWQITEEESFFRKSVSIQKEITHPHKRLQHYAGRYLLKVLDPAFPVNKILLDGNRPYLPDNHFHFSISHYQNFAAAILSKSTKVGIDIEGESEKLAILQKKYLTETELTHLHTAHSEISLRQLLCLCWSAKETMFKWYQKGKVDFRSDMHVFSVNRENETLLTQFGKEIQTDLIINYKTFDKMVLTYLLA